MLLISSLLVISISLFTGNSIFNNRDYYKIISLSKVECLEKKIQFTVEFEDKNLFLQYLEFKLKLQSKYNSDTFFVNCLFGIPQNSQKGPSQVNYENNNEKKSNFYLFMKSQKLKSKKKAICSFNPLYKQGKYILKSNPENNNVIIEKEIELELIPCDFRNTRLTFRQVNTFNYDKKSKCLSFLFSGLSLRPKNTKETISFLISLYIRDRKELEPVEAKCNLIGYSAIEDIQDTFQPEVYSCSYIFNGEVEFEEPYMKLYGSESITGFPSEPELLHPFLSDIFIKNGSLPNFSDPSIFEIIPAIIKEPKYNFDNFSEKGILEITAEIAGNFVVGTSFNIPLISPAKTHLSCEISSYINNLVTINCSTEGEIYNECIIFERIIVKEKKKELFVLPGMKSDKLIRKIMRKSVVEEKLDIKDINLKNDKQISYSSFHIYEDTYKCIDDSKINIFYIHANEEKKYIFVSVSNSNIILYDGKYRILSKNYFDNSEYGNYSIISVGAGCFQVYYLEEEFLRVNEGNKLCTKSLNILNSEPAIFEIYSKVDDQDYKIILYIYCSENNFVKNLQIDEKKQKLEIDKEKDQYYYKINYNRRSYDITYLNATFNLNNKNYITITFKIKLSYTSPIVWMCVSLGSAAMIIILLYVVGYILKYCKKRKMKKEEELNEALFRLAREEVRNERNEYKKMRENLRIQKRKKREMILQKQEKIKKIKKTVNQVVQRASFLYDCIKNNFTLINETCLLCAKTESLIELSDENEDDEEYDEEEDEEDDEEDDFGNINIISNNYDKNKNKIIDVIDDINKGKYKSFIDYISPKRCEHFYHDSCRNKFRQAYEKFDTKAHVNYCNFCKVFLTLENMQKFGCFFSKEFFVDYFRDTINHRFYYELARLKIIRAIDNIFHSKIDKSLVISEDKKWRIDFIKQMNKKYIDHHFIFDKSYDEFRFYKLSINEDLIKEKKKLDYELKEMDEEIEERKNEREKRKEREEREKREREEREDREETEETEENRRREWEENRKKERREREEIEKKEKKEQREKRRPVDLLRCQFCFDKCLFCGGKISGSGKSYGYVKSNYYYKAHGSCIPNSNKKKCIICLKNNGATRCNNQCYHCFNKRNKMEEKCYYCKERLIFWDK